MYNKFTIETQSSDTSEFQDFVNKLSKSILFKSSSAQGISFSIDPLQSKAVADFTVPISVVSSVLTISSFDTDQYKIELDTGNFNTNIDVGIVPTSSITVSPNSNLFSVSCPDFNLSGVQAGDSFIFHKDSLSPFNAQSQGTVFLITGVDTANKKVYAQNSVGVSSETVTGTVSFLSFFKNEISPSHVVKLNTGFHEQTKGTYGIVMATDRYLIINSDKELITGTTTLASGSLSIFSQIIDSVSLYCSSNCNVLVDGIPTLISSNGSEGVFVATLQCSSLAIQNPTSSRVNVVCGYSTSSFNNSVSCGV